MSKKTGGHRNIPRLNYGAAHEKIREAWRPKVEAGQVDCWRCGHRIKPGTPWDMGHNDDDPTRYEGPEHMPCSRAAGARKRNAIAAAQRRTTPPGTPSRSW